MLSTIADKDQIRSRKQLAGLRLVNKLFDALLSPILFREVDKSRRSQLCHVLVCPHVRHIRRICFTGLDSNGCDENFLVQDLLLRMPQLEGFIWSSALLAAETLRVLYHACPRIKVLHIKFPDNMEQALSRIHLFGRTPETFRLQDLAPFGDLEEISLENIIDTVAKWPAQIIEVLKKSPMLRKLRLSMSRELLRIPLRFTVFREFFDDLCTSYQQTGAAPLHLRSLSFGTAIFPPKPSHLDMLTDVSFLEHVSFWNTNVRDPTDPGSPILLHITGLRGDNFGPARCPNLRRLMVERYDPTIHTFLANVGTHSGQLGVWYNDQHSAKPTALLRPSLRYPALPLHFRVLEISLPNFLGRMGDGGPYTAEQRLGDLISGDKGTLKGLKVRVALNKMAMTDPATSSLQLLKKALPKLVGLTQIAVVSRHLEVTNANVLVRVAYELACS